MHGELIHGPVLEVILKKRPEWSSQDVICLSCLDHFRAEYVEDVLESQKGDLSALEDEVIKSLRDQEILSENLNVEFDRHLTFGQRLADRVAEFGGSWTFILAFGSVLVLWIGINSVALLRRPFDPYPYILLNLVLSCLAAIQAPIIMMSQNRQEAKDQTDGSPDARRVGSTGRRGRRAGNEFSELRILRKWLKHVTGNHWRQAENGRPLRRLFLAV